MVLRYTRERLIVSLKEFFVLGRLRVVLVQVLFEVDLTANHAELIAMELFPMVGHAVGHLVLLYIKTAQVDLFFAFLIEFILGCGPVCKDIICLLQIIIKAAEIAFNSYLHLVTEGDLLPRQLNLVMGLFKDTAMVLS